MKKHTLAKKLIGFTLILFMITAAFSIQIGASDYENDWAKGVIDSFIAQNIVVPDADGNIRPQDDITRAEIIAVINKSFNFTNTKAISYADVSSTDPFYNDVQIAEAIGYMPNSGPSSQFNPYGTVTREEMMIILARILELQPKAPLVEDRYNDYNTMSAEGKGALGALLDPSVRIAGSLGNDSFFPQDTIRRNLAFSLISRANDYYKALQSGRRQYSSTNVDTTLGSNSDNTKNFHNVTIMGRNAVLENVTVWGNLTIDRAAGSGSVTVRNVTVKGNVFVYGGESVDFINTQIKALTVNKTNNNIAISIRGTSSIDEITARSGVEINASSMVLSKITLTNDISRGVKVGVDVNTVREITVQSAGVNLTLDAPTVSELIIARNASGTLVEITRGTTVSKATVNARSEIRGAGTLLTHQLNVSDVTIALAGRTSTTSSARTTSNTTTTVQSASYITYYPSTYYPSNYPNYSYSQYSSWFFAQYGAYPSYDQYISYINNYYPYYNTSNLSYPYNSYEEYVSWYRATYGSGFTPTLDDYYRAVYNSYGYYPWGWSSSNVRTVSTIEGLRNAINAGVTNIILSSGGTVTLSSGLTIPSGYNVTIASGTTLSLNTWELVVNGSLSGAIAYNGLSISGSGTVNSSWTGSTSSTYRTVSTIGQLESAILEGVSYITLNAGYTIPLDRSITIPSWCSVTIAGNTTLRIAGYTLTVNGSISGSISYDSGSVIGSGSINGVWGSGSWWNNNWWNNNWWWGDSWWWGTDSVTVTTESQLQTALSSNSISSITITGTISINSVLTIPSGKTINNLGTININAQITNNGTITNYATVVQNAEIVNNETINKGSSGWTGGPISGSGTVTPP